MPKLDVVSHEYNEETGIDKYVFNPGNMEALVKIVDEGNGPEGLLGVQAMAVQQESYPDIIMTAALESAGLPAGVRAETLTMAQLSALTDAIYGAAE